MFVTMVGTDQTWLLVGITCLSFRTYPNRCVHYEAKKAWLLVEVATPSLKFAGRSPTFYLESAVYRLRCNMKVQI